MDPLDFSGKHVFVVGGSSGIGNGIARAFHDRGAVVHVSGTRSHAADYSADDGSDLLGLHYNRLELSDPGAIDTFEPTFPRLDILVLSQGTVVYGRREFARPVWDKVMAVNLHSVMACATRLHDMLAEASGSLILV